eukprot:UN12940
MSDLMKRSSESAENLAGGTLSYFLSRVPLPMSLAKKYPLSPLILTAAHEAARARRTESFMCILIPLII